MEAVRRRALLACDNKSEYVRALRESPTWYRFGNDEIGYWKKDGSVREAFGTLNAALCGKHINGRGQSPESWGCSCYFDIEKGQFRSFRWANIIDILS